MNEWTLGSLFTGYGGLDMGVKAALEGECREAWCSDVAGCGGKGVRLLPTPTASQMDGRKSPAYSGSGSFYDIVQAGRRGLAPYVRGIARWEGVFRSAPDPIDETGRLSTLFVEWMMGLPEGWVTDPDLGLSRAQQLTMLGNGVVPQQAERAVMLLAGMAEATKEVA